jgi:hypothetical protein
VHFAGPDGRVADGEYGRGERHGPWGNTEDDCAAGSLGDLILARRHPLHFREGPGKTRESAGSSGALPDGITGPRYSTPQPRLPVGARPRDLGAPSLPPMRSSGRFARIHTRLRTPCAPPVSHKVEVVTPRVGGRPRRRPRPLDRSPRSPRSPLRSPLRALVALVAREPIHFPPGSAPPDGNCSRPSSGAPVPFPLGSRANILRGSRNGAPSTRG